MNECLDQEMPACDQICINEEGTHKCACQAGYVLSLDGRSCKVGGSKFHLNIQSYWCITWLQSENLYIFMIFPDFG